MGDIIMNYAQRSHTNVHTHTIYFTE